MFDRILGNYLVETGYLTGAQLKEVYQEQERSRVRLGVIAISEKLMTVDQVNEVNKMQAVMDKKFGDIAVEYHYLTEEQVKRLIALQGNIYLVFVQTILDKNFLAMEEIAAALNTYQRKNGFTTTDIEDLKSCDPDRIMPLLLGDEEKVLRELVTVFVKTVARLIDYHVYPERVAVLEEYEAEKISVQINHGDHEIFTAVSGSGESMFRAAVAFAGEKFVLEEEDAMDAMCEFLNCVNGIFATKMSFENVDIDMMPPEFFGEGKMVKGEKFYRLTLHVKETVVDYLVSFNQGIELN